MTAFLDLLEQKYYDMISVSQISEESFVTRSTFYRYFKDKTALLMTVIEDTVEKTVPDQPLLTQYVTYVEQYWPLLRHLSPSRQSRADLHDILNQILWEMIERRVQGSSTVEDPVIDMIRQAKHRNIMISAVEGIMMGILERYVSEGAENINATELEETVQELVAKFSK
ncbi:TetR/AcrR family transcriptional regulator [Secundilactobacillus similis]|jgi:AcrR family transcriptional regulator|uniref:HTH tetR-type domain-containing protein n=2 Tax=Secundilactobacillus similis TaxID=414682 RepID=A0A0R2EXU4_9LACO|nr:helix-turn-helix domain-containing protein [Secundilactobacillus similis]KRN21250.1 hypothetical protein FD14_GL001200 [Secundilactobacillus similis DSM 23365 = JCM 2765]